ncbi:hypothetical protein HQ590_00770 [bacterium]|nr:hypothetical protein [bacterium]
METFGLVGGEVGDDRFRLLPAYSGANAGRSAGTGGLDCRVDWPGAGRSRLAGKSVRLRISLKRGRYPEPRLYAVDVGGAEDGAMSADR